MDGKPVAICRLKRVAADNRDDVTHLPARRPRTQKNGKKVALVGAGPASLTVANDLMPLGYEVTIFEKLSQPGGLMRINIPAFRLPAEVLDEEIGYIVDMGVDVRYNTPVESLKKLADSGEYDAVFVGSGAPKGKELEIPGRHDSDQVFIGIEWLESIHFGHVDSVGKRVLIIGVGNTAMDCCRSAKRLGATDVKVIARKTRKYFKASPWELEDAEEEQVEILENLQPVRFVVENGTLTGMEFEKFSSTEVERPAQTGDDRPRDHPVRHGRARHRPGQRVPLDRARHGDRVRQVGHAGGGQDDVHVHAARHLLRRRRGVRAGQHHLGGRAGPPGGDLHPQPLPGRRRSPNGRRHGMTLASTKMGLHEWAYSNNYDPVQRQKMQHVELPVRFAKMTTEVELGFTPEQTAAEVERCLNCDVQTHFTDSLCIECDACIDICPDGLPDHHQERRRGGPARAAHRPGHRAEPGAVRVRRPEADGTRDGEGRERLPPLRPVCRALSHLCVGHAEVRRCDSSGRRCCSR